MRPTRVTIVFAVLPAILAIQGSAASPGLAAQTETWPAAITARYRLKFQGVEVGKLDLNSTTTSANYTLSGGAQLSVLFGAFKIAVSGNAAGGLTGIVPSPKTFALDWKGGPKKGATRIGFDGVTATTISVEPPAGTGGDRIPLLAEHKRNVVDPLSAIMTLTSGGARPCDKSVAVFDGKHRYTIEFAFKKDISIELKGDGPAKTERGVVCRITYTPVAGHKNKADTAHFASNRDMEVVLRRLPGSTMTVPHAVYIPTAYGTASMVIERVDVTSRTLGKLALTE